MNSHVGLILLYTHAGMAFDIFVLTRLLQDAAVRVGRGGYD